MTRSEQAGLDSVAVLDAALSALRDVSPGFEPTLHEERAGTWFFLPLPQAAEYRFQVWVYTDGEPQICARLVDDQGQTQDDYFWYRSYDPLDYSCDEVRLTAFLTDLGRLASAPSRIEVRQGFILRSFEASTEGERVGFVGGTALFAPSLRRYQRIYRSAAPLSAMG